MARGPTWRRAGTGAEVHGRLESGRAREALVAGFPEPAPDLVAEVVSPSDRVGEVAATAQEWLDAGVRLVRVVDAADRTVST